MSSLADASDLVGFFSYSREDDEGSGGRLSKLRERIQEELRSQLGRTKRDFRLWQDKVAIAHGELWKDTIKKGISESAFFIPIITPTAVRSSYCKIEFESFLAREKELDRNNLIFPILYVPVPALTDDRLRQDPLLTIIHSRQYEDLQNLRHLDPSNEAVALRVITFCANISRALQQEWLSPEERREAEARRVAEAELRRQEKLQEEARQRAEEERRREEAETKRRLDEAEAKKRRRAEEERRREEAETKRRLDEAETKKRRRAEEERRGQEELQQAEVRRIAEEERRQQEAEIKRRAEAEKRRRAERRRQEAENKRCLDEAEAKERRRADEQHRRQEKLQEEAIEAKAADKPPAIPFNELFDLIKAFLSQKGYGPERGVFLYPIPDTITNDVQRLFSLSQDEKLVAVLTGKFSNDKVVFTERAIHFRATWFREKKYIVPYEELRKREPHASITGWVIFAETKLATMPYLEVKKRDVVELLVAIRQRLIKRSK
jgi:DNA repair exonuclease SbcCD ATPase subunit